MIINGSMNYTTSGRKKKSQVRRKKRDKEFKEFNGRSSITNTRTGDGTEYVSAPDCRNSSSVSNFSTEEWKQLRIAISSNYTLAPAYNKGAYQVISKSEIKDIGR